jgi:tRNA dimethylallyltransferase
LDHKSHPVIIIILGPTGVGKSAAALFLAQRFNGEIINCDSRQVYRGFDIGTDKPTIEMRLTVPHHLLDIADASTQFSAADFVREALVSIQLIKGRGRLPFIVGGTGLYLKALIEGLFPGPGRDPALRERLDKEARERGLDSMHQELAAVDPAYACLVGPRDRIRIIRALEVFLLTGKPISEHFASSRSAVSGFHRLEIGLKLERQELYRRIEQRVDRMFRGGIIEEVEYLLSQGIDETAPPFRALGYKQVLRFVKKEISAEEAVALTKMETRRYAKRQITWFKKMAGVNWFEARDYAAMTDFIEWNLAE